MSAKNVFGGGSNYVIPDLPRPEIPKISPMEAAWDRLVEKHHSKIFDLAWEKWYPAYYDILFDRAWDLACEADTGLDEVGFEKLVDQKLDAAIQAELEISFGPFYELEQKKLITEKMVETEAKKGKA